MTARSAISRSACPLPSREAPRICLVGLDNLPLLAPEYRHLRIGGESVQQTLLARALARAGYDVSMAVYDHGQPDGGVRDGILTFKTYRPEAGLPLLRFFHPRWTGLWSALKRADADIYYTSCASKDVGLVAAFCRRFGRRFVFRSASDTDCDRSRVLVKYARDRWLYSLGLRRADAILVQSRFQARMLSASYGLQGRLAGMLVEKPARLRANRNIDVLWVSNFRRLKRPDRLLELAKSLPRLTFHMIGGPSPTEEAVFRNFEREVRGLGNIVLHGRLPYAAANEIYDRAKVLVNTSEIEGFPNAYLQAWIRGVPVVTFLDPDGVIEKQGLGAAVKTLSGMRAATRRLTEDGAAWAAASERCLLFMEREFAEDRILGAYLEAFEEVLNRTADGRRNASSPEAHHA